jgi:hypothetical protein
VSNCPEVHEHVLLAKKALKEAEATTFAAMTQGHASIGRALNPNRARLGR